MTSPAAMLRRPSDRRGHDAGPIAAVRALLVEYQASLGLDLEFQGFAAELADAARRLRPAGAACSTWRRSAAAAVGCIGVRPMAEGRCEMKRLFVRPAGRGRGLGRALAEAAIARARAIGYSRMLLDTLPMMGAAQAMYESARLRRRRAVPGEPDPRLALPGPGSL